AALVGRRSVPYTTLFRSASRCSGRVSSSFRAGWGSEVALPDHPPPRAHAPRYRSSKGHGARTVARNGPCLSERGTTSKDRTLRRSEEHTSELQSREKLVC